jgi:hypothetical protein
MTCSAGTCLAEPFSCPTGLTDCAGTCKDTTADSTNCGACGSACDPFSKCETSACVLKEWQELAPIDNAPELSDFTPAGSNVLYTVSDGTFESFTFPDAANPLGVWTTLANGNGNDQYDTLAIVGTSVYLIDLASVQVYDATMSSWTTEDVTLADSTSNSQTTGDDSGNVYAFATDGNLVQFATAAATSQAFASGIAHEFFAPRVAWDSAAQVVYIGDFEDTTGTFYSFDPATQMFKQLASVPDPSGLSNAFCSDRNGHLFTATAACSTETVLWEYTAATDTWAQVPVPLPFAHGCNASCTVTADGWLYFGAGEVGGGGGGIVPFATNDANRLVRIQL